MHIKKLFFPGQFDDAYIYMQKLLLFDADGELFFADLDRIVGQIEDRHDSSVKSIGTHLFTRNDWLAGERILSLFANTAIRQAFVESIEGFPDQIDVDRRHIRKSGRLGVSDLLDVTVYNRRVFMGTDTGTYHADLNWTSREVEVDRAIRKRHDAMCVQVNAKYGSVSISCGDEGLFTRFDEFGRLANERRVADEWRSVRKQSHKTSWFFGNLLNYESPIEPMLLQVSSSTNTIRNPETRTPEKVIVGFEGDPTSVDHLLTGIFPMRERSLFSKNPLLFLFNTSNRLYAQTEERTFFEVVVKHEKNQRKLAARESKVISDSPLGRILDVVTAGKSVVLELFNSVQLLTRGRLYTLAEGEALSIRSYPHSKRFRNLVTIVVDEGVYVIALFDESVAMENQL